MSTTSAVLQKIDMGERMNNLVIFIKINASSGAIQQALVYVEESLSSQTLRWYYTNETDIELIQDLIETVDDLLESHIVFIEFRKTPTVFVKSLYVGRVKRVELGDNSRYKITYSIAGKITSPLVIDNFMKYSTLNISEDFEENSHINFEESSALTKQLNYAVFRPRNINNEEPVEYPSIDSESQHHYLAQKNEYCQRMFNVLLPSKKRGEYQRDYDRIVNSKAFRRMVDKAQIFTSAKGDHYRTRMTHTLCVVQIARSVASELNMNVPLTEAIALGHDLGHTPFGHQGERTLDDLARKYADIGFKHNFQSMRVASVLEEEYVEYSGLDLSVQVLEGMWKHTKTKKGADNLPVCNVEDFLPQDTLPELVAILHPENSFCSTVEGQIVAIADEIAQRSHDLDDALSAGLLSIEELLEALSLRKLNSFKSQIEDVQKKMETSRKKQRLFVSEKELLNSRISSQVIKYFISDVVESFKNNSADEMEDTKEYFAENHCVDRQLLHFSLEGRALNDYLETIVTKRVINSPEVAAFDDKAKRVVTKLFELYYENPRLLHTGTLQRIFIEMRKKSENVIHFQDGDIGLVNEEWTRIKNPQESERLRDLRENFPARNLTQYKSVKEFLESGTLTAEEREEVSQYCEACQREYTEKHKILVRAICDFISGMTDAYALNEYRKLEY